MTMKIARTEDWSRIASFLEKANLSVKDVDHSKTFFTFIENTQNEIVATLGIEKVAHIGILRSLAISKEVTEQDLLLLFKHMFKIGNEHGIEAIYLASNKQSSRAFFNMLGFKEEDKGDLPTELIESAHVKHILTVDNSFFMKLPFDNVDK